MTAYRNAIDQTVTTIEKRARYYRNLIVVITFLGFGSVLWSGISRSWVPLAGALLFLPFCGLYLFVDTTLLKQWRHNLFESWGKMELYFNALHQAIMAISTLPENTVDSMLSTLPISQDLILEQDISSNTRSAITAVVKIVQSIRSDLIMIKTAAYSIVGGVLGTAAALWMWQPLLGLFAISLLVVPHKVARKRRLKHGRAEIITVHQQKGFDWQKFHEFVMNIDRSPITETEKKKFLNIMRAGSNLE